MNKINNLECYYCKNKINIEYYDIDNIWAICNAKGKILNHKGKDIILCFCCYELYQICNTCTYYYFEEERKEKSYHYWNEDFNIDYLYSNE